MKSIFCLLVLIVLHQTLFAQNINSLWGNRNVPNAKPTPANYIEKDTGGKAENVSVPTLISFFPEKTFANGTAVIICPGGGYRYLAMYHEGYTIAKEFVKKGITAFVLKYRLPSNLIMVDKSIGPLQDAQRAIQLIRERSIEWGIDTTKVGIMGFSAGGHVASTAGTHFNTATISNPTNISLRPNFLLLVYPVITFGEFAHAGSATKLLGEKPDSAQLRFYSNELRVTRQTPPTFLVQAENDVKVPVQNSLLFYSALLKNNVQAEMHLYVSGGHGFGLVNKITKDYWFDRCINFLDQIGMMKKL